MAEIEELLTIIQVSEILKVHPGTLHQWDLQGRLKTVRIGSRQGIGDRRYRIVDVENYVKR